MHRTRCLPHVSTDFVLKASGAQKYHYFVSGNPKGSFVKWSSCWSEITQLHLSSAREKQFILRFNSHFPSTFALPDRLQLPFFLHKFLTKLLEAM